MSLHPAPIYFLSLCLFFFFDRRHRLVQLFRQELEFGRRHRRAFGALHRRLLLGRKCCSRALGGFALAHLPVILPRIENQMQPRHHLLDRRQLRRADRARRADRQRPARPACLADRPRRFALRADFTALALRARLALRTSLAVRPGLPSGPACRVTLQRRACPRVRPCLADRALPRGPSSSGSSGMALRSGSARLAARALRSLSSLPDRRFVGHVLTPKMILRAVL